MHIICQVYLLTKQASYQKMFLSVLLFVASVSLAGAIHEEKLAAPVITADEYLDQLTASVDVELEENSMMGHKPPNRWYYNPVAITEQASQQKLEQALAMILVRHYNYLLHVRRDLRKINNSLPGHLDLWPLQSFNHSDEAGSKENQSDEDRFIGWKQPEWMDNLFNKMGNLNALTEDLNEE